MNTIYKHMTSSRTKHSVMSISLVMNVCGHVYLSVHPLSKYFCFLPSLIFLSCNIRYTNFPASFFSYKKSKIKLNILLKANPLLGR